MSHYRLKAPLPAILDEPGGLNPSVRIPAGAVLSDFSKPSTTLLGMIGVYWKGWHYSHMEICNQCLRLANRHRGAREHYINLIVQHDQMIREGKSDASTLDITIKRARRRRNAAARLLLAHRGTHEDLSLPKTRTAGQP